MKILITGGCGFIGSNFIRYILTKYPDYKITNLDKLTYCGNLDNLKDIENNPNYKFIKGDICDTNIVNQVVKNSDVIINFAAATHVDRSIVDASDFISTNIQGVYVLLEAVKRNNIDRFISISTDEVYGSVEKSSSKETDNLSPNSPYAASKAAGDLLALSYYTTFKAPVIITRSSNNFGPYQYPEKVIPLFVTNLLEGKRVPLYGDGLNVRDWLYVLDNCKAIDLVLHKGTIGEIYNIGGGYEIPNIKLTQTILELLDQADERIEYVEDRLGHDRRYSLNSTKINNLGFKVEKNFDVAIKETVEWYKNNSAWWKAIKK
ncbi:MAG: dTDP-glucose 4,6-dehydratase [Candidatus Omnitrophota bacterium]